jgi:hypothetical protein
MAWGSSVPSFKIRQQALSFKECKRIHNDPKYRHKNHTDANIQDSSPGRSNYWIITVRQTNPVTKQREDGYALRMYQTNILTWFSDNTTIIQFHDTGITRDVITSFGPRSVYFWRDNRLKVQAHQRFGPSRWREPNYPCEGVLTIAPDGKVLTPLVDKKYRIKPALRKERRGMLEKYTNNALPRMLLGEFGDIWWSEIRGYRRPVFGRERSSLVGQMPYDCTEVFRLFSEGADHDAIAKHLTRMRTGPDANDYNDAVIKSCREIGRTALASPHWYEWYNSASYKVNINDWS